MICPICHKKEANLTVSRRFNGVVIQGAVCEDCYDSALALSQDGFYYAFLRQPDKSCRVCGRKLGEIERTLMVGCKYCYKEFSKELKPLIEKLQGMDTDEN